MSETTLETNARNTFREAELTMSQWEYLNNVERKLTEKDKRIQVLEALVSELTESVEESQLEEVEESTTLEDLETINEVIS